MSVEPPEAESPVQDVAEAASEEVKPSLIQRIRRRFRAWFLRKYPLIVMLLLMIAYRWARSWLPAEFVDGIISDIMLLAVIGTAIWIYRRENKKNFKPGEIEPEVSTPVIRQPMVRQEDCLRSNDAIGHDLLESFLDPVLVDELLIEMLRLTRSGELVWHLSLLRSTAYERTCYEAVWGDRRLVIEHVPGVETYRGGVPSWDHQRIFISVEQNGVREVLCDALSGTIERKRMPGKTCSGEALFLAVMETSVDRRAEIAQSLVEAMKSVDAQAKES
jgi:hypothetical protein